MSVEAEASFGFTLMNRMAGMRRKNGRESCVMVLGEPHGENIELLIAGEHRIKSEEIADNLLNDLGSSVHKDSMDNRSHFPELFWAASGKQETERELAMPLFV